MVNPTEGLEDHQPGVVNELVHAGNQKEIVGKDDLALTEFLGRKFKTANSDGLITLVKYIREIVSEIRDHWCFK